ncbi:MAG: type I-B CRISPR-associated protein Cas7/Cst2/DevR [Paludibacteraceae bacterium]|nr:type I-B CRISPR-associated protein Cas7/Cst2/DevR [Paludibacteraceae bacterium]
MNTQGLILIDVDAAALNNAGKNDKSNFDNAVKTKTIFKNGNCYVYVSGQAWRNWWRMSLQKNQEWILSPVTREDKIAFTNADPIKYPDDDIFGYMRAATEIVTDAKGKEKKENITVTRVSPLKNSVLVSASAVRPVENWSSMARQEGDSVPYAKQEYSAVMKGMFCLDLDMAGTFSNYNKTGFKNLSDKLKDEALDVQGSEEIDDPYVPNQKLIRLPLATRIQRATDTIKALKNISGGAMQTNNMADVTPKFIILATTKTGNHPFSHVVKSTGDRDETAELNIKGLKEIIEDYKDDFDGKIFIGRRSGFFDDDNKELEKLATDFKDIVCYGPVNKMIDAYIEQLKEQIK